MSFCAIILGAGKGTRMKSSLPKVMHKVAGREMINMVIDEVDKLEASNVSVVVSDEMDQYQKIIKNSHKNLDINFVIQKQRNGTGHAVATALENIEDLGENVVILYGDTPLISKLTIKKMLDSLKDHDLCVLGFDEFDENKYGRLVVDDRNNLLRIVEFSDANKQERNISLCNSGVMAVKSHLIHDLISKIDNNNAAGEYYLTDIVGFCDKKTFIKIDKQEVLGVNSRVELSNVEEIKQNDLRKKHMQNGVTLLDPKTIYFSYDSQIANDCVIHPNVFFGKNVKIKSNCEIKSFSHIEGADIEENCIIGPFARIRPDTSLDKNVKIGNFVEVKKSKLDQDVKINHLTYIGDSEIGKNTNIGAGVITCNYDGYNKSKTQIGQNVFVGSNSAFIAPVTVGDGSVIGAGSIITKEVSQNELAVSRAKQVNIKDGGINYHNKKNDEN